MVSTVVCMYVLSHIHVARRVARMDQPNKVVNPTRGQLNRENEYFLVAVRTCEFGLARQVWQSRPASACSSPYSG